MSNKILNVRIQNKYDTYENWMASSLVLGAGEIAIANIPSGDQTGLTPPAIGIKVGDGSKTFAQLDWIQSTAGDVHSWAKATDKPSYTADEISGLAEYISGEIQDTNTEYSFSLTENYKVKIQKKDVGGEYADYQVIDLTSAFNAKADKVTSATAGNFAGLDAEGNLTDSGKKAADFATAEQGAKADTAVQPAALNDYVTKTAATGYDDILTKTAASTTYASKQPTESHISNGDLHVTADQKTGWDTGIQAAKDAAKAAQDDVDALETLVGQHKTAADTGIQEAKTAASEALTHSQGVASDLAEYETANNEAVAAAQKAADDAQDAVDTLSSKVGTVPADKTVVQMISEAQTAATYDDTKVKEDIAANAAAIKTEKERMDAFMTLADGETLNSALDSLKEIQDFITNEAADADILLGKVSALEGMLEGIGGEGEQATVVAYITAAIDALKIGDYAKAADLTELAGRVATLEGKVSTWDAAEQNAKDYAKEYADGLNTAMNTRVEALEAIDHDHSNKGVLDGITSEQVAKWDAAQANVIESISGVGTEVTGKDVKVTSVSTDLLVTGTDTLIFDCGSSAL